jgi:hypothetical protein
MPSRKEILQRIAPGAYHAASYVKWYIRIGVRPRANVFRSIYRANTWGSSVSHSGSGSEMSQTAALRQALPKLVVETDCRILLDVPCGDFHWMAETDVAVDKYIGADIVPELIEANSLAYGRDGYRFVQADVTVDPLPRADVILCRDCLVHLSYGDIFRVLRNLKATGSTYLLTTTYVGRQKNRNIPTGAWRPINLERSPFYFPEPLCVIDEGCTEGDGRFADKSLALWRMTDLNIPAASGRRVLRSQRVN